MVLYSPYAPQPWQVPISDELKYSSHSHSSHLLSFKANNNGESQMCSRIFSPLSDDDIRGVIVIFAFFPLATNTAIIRIEFNYGAAPFATIGLCQFCIPIDLIVGQSFRLHLLSPFLRVLPGFQSELHLRTHPRTNDDCSH